MYFRKVGFSSHFQRKCWYLALKSGSPSSVNPCKMQKQEVMDTTVMHTDRLIPQGTRSQRAEYKLSLLWSHCAYPLSWSILADLSDCFPHSIISMPPSWLMLVYMFSALEKWLRIAVVRTPPNFESTLDQRRARGCEPTRAPSRSINSSQIAGGAVSGQSALWPVSGEQWEKIWRLSVFDASFWCVILIPSLKHQINHS